MGIFNITEALAKTMSIPGDSLLLRSMLVIMTYWVAVVVPNVQALISLAGAVAGSSTALLIPPLLELALIDHLESLPDVTAPGGDGTTSPRSIPPHQQQSTPDPSFLGRLCKCDISGKYWMKKLKCLALFWMGLAFGALGAYAAIADIVSIWFDTEKKNT